MCGICGIVQTDSQPASEDLLKRMARTMRHRGPDEEGFKVQGPAGFGFQRLFVIDLPGGRQPMSNDDGSTWIVFNGEIYNFLALRQHLEKTGRHRFKTKSDTEVLLRLYEEYGPACVSDLRGMFAFAIWDSKKQSLFLARDRLGKKPLVYAAVPGAFIFGSEIKALLPHPAVSREISYPAIDAYLTYQYIPSPQTIFKEIHKLPPAHTLLWHNGQFQIERYWEPRFQTKTTLSFEEAQLQMLSTLQESTRLRMQADVPLGAFLSGGLDSSAVVALMSEASSRPVKTFSIGFEEADYSELRYARQVADHFRTDHHELIVKPETAEVLPKLVWHYGEPFADASALPSYHLSKMTRSHVTVALSGDGGDETLGGYDRYQTMRHLAAWAKLPAKLRRSLQSVSRLLGPKGDSYSWMRRAKALVEFGDADLRDIYPGMVRVFGASQKKRLYSTSLKEHIQKIDSSAYLQALLHRYPAEEGIDPYLYGDLCSYLPDCLMVKTDIASMAHSLEVRSPFLDHHFVELTASFPSSWKMGGLNQSKIILKHALKGKLPPDILSRRKQGFAVPISRWFREDLNSYLRSILLSPQSLKRELFDRAVLEMLLKEHESQERDHGSRLYALLMLELWFQAYMDAPQADP